MPHPTPTSLRAALLGALLGLALTASGAQAQGKGELHIYNWTDYTSPEVVKKFEAETGIKVSVDTYDSNETLLAKLKSGATGYDIAVASSDFVSILAKEGLIQKVEAAKFADYKNLDKKWQSPPWDPGNLYSVPYDWGTTSFGYDTAVYTKPIDSLKTFYDPPAEFKGKLGMFGSPTEVMSLALVYLGKPQCNTDPATLKEVQALLEKQKPAVKVYNSDGIQDRMASGETVAHQVWSGDFQRARAQRASLKFVYAKEGGIAWMDNIVVPTHAPNAANAKLFMQFLLKPENAGLHSSFAGYPTAVVGAEKFTKPEVASAPEYLPPAGWKFTFAPACEEKAIRAYDRIWTKLRQ